MFFRELYRQCNSCASVNTKCLFHLWVQNLAHEEYVFCVAFSDDDHKWTIEFQDRDVAVRHKHDADTSSSCSSGSSLINI